VDGQERPANNGEIFEVHRSHSGTLVETAASATMRIVTMPFMPLHRPSRAGRLALLLTGVTFSSERQTYSRAQNTPNSSKKLSMTK